ncbi:IS200/IS605 family transposase [Aerococcus viridans]|uniref:IS200/IS605 family transposase n=3 Tax=Aerococcus viridans TaxID=1377 RepID=UPI003B21BA19
MIVKTRTNVYDFNFHLVWVTKYRKEIFTTIEKQNAMQDMLTHICDKHDIVIQSLQVMPDHIHMLISFNPKHAASSIVKTLKGKSARLWFKAYPETKTMLWGGHLWTPSYFMSTVGSMSKETVKKYIENQLTEYNDGRPRT